MLLVISKVLLPSIVTLIGVFRFQAMNTAFRFIFFQVFMYVVLLSLTKQVMIFQKLNSMERDTQLLYNFYLPIETLLLIWSAFVFTENKYLKFLSRALSGLFLLTLVVECYFKGLSHYATNSDSIANIILLVLFSVVLYVEFHKRALTWYSSPIIWAALGITLFSATTFAYMSVYDYLNQMDQNTNRTVFRILFGVLANVRYLCIGLAFWLLPKDYKYSNVRDGK